MKSIVYLIPRTFIVGLCLLAIVLGADPIVRQLVIERLENNLGGKVNISKISCDLFEGKVYLRDFSIADAQSPMTNLFQSDLTYLKFDHAKLLDRQVVITQSRSSHVHFGAPRTQSGNLPDHPPVFDQEQTQRIEFVDSQEAIRNVWQDQFQAKLEKIELNELPVTLFAVAKATNERWNRDFDLHHKQLETLNQKILQLVKADPQLLDFQNQASGEELSRRPVNPLRNVSSAKRVPTLLTETIAAIDELKRQQLVLQQNAQSDIEALDAAFKRDVTTISQNKTDHDIGVLPQTISDLLLTELNEDLATDALALFAWFKSKKNLAIQHRPVGRGVDFFQEHFTKPGIVIDQIEIDGEAMFAKEHFHFAGHAYNLSDNPRGHDQPTRFELRAQGQRHFHVNCVLDQRKGINRDTLSIEFPSFNLGEQVLGSENEMLITLSPATQVNGRIDLASDQEHLEGTMTLDFSNVALVVQQLNEIAGGKEIEVRLNHQLSTLGNFQCTSKITGSDHSPALKLNSNLGEMIATAMESVSDLTQENSMLVRNQKIKDFYRTHVQPLQQNIKSEVEKISGRLDDQISKTEVIQGAQRTAASRWPSIR